MWLGWGYLQSAFFPDTVLVILKAVLSDSGSHGVHVVYCSVLTMRPRTQLFKVPHSVTPETHTNAGV